MADAFISGVKLSGFKTMELIGKSVCFVVCDIGTEIYNTAIS
jgi:hypothetical protein